MEQEAVGTRCAQYHSPLCRRCLQLGWRLGHCCCAREEQHRTLVTGTGTGPAGVGAWGPTIGSECALCVAEAG